MTERCTKDRSISCSLLGEIGPDVGRGARLCQSRKSTLCNPVARPRFTFTLCFVRQCLNFRP